jgi:hypothetical protein
MPEPTETSQYNFPLQLPGQAGRGRMNTTIEMIDGALAAQAGHLASLSLETVRIKRYPLIIAVAGQTVVPLPETYQTGQRRLRVVSGSAQHVEGVHWEEVDDQSIRFFAPRVEGELIEIDEYQIGPDGGVTPGYPEGPVYSQSVTPTGLVNSTDGTDGNGTFTVPHIIAPDTVPVVWISDILKLQPTIDYTWHDNVIEILPGSKPIGGEWVTVQYQWRN